ncbi:MAG: hypothetical protein ABW075_13120 [Aeromicrobium sp.]
MLTRTATRRSAVVLSLALVAMLLVALSGSARAAQHRASAGNGQSIAAPHPSRQAVVVPAATQDHQPWHLDLDAALLERVTPHGHALVSVVTTHATSLVTHESVPAVGRAPPAV